MAVYGVNLIYGDASNVLFYLYLSVLIFACGVWLVLFRCCELEFRCCNDQTCCFSVASLIRHVVSVLLHRSLQCCFTDHTCCSSVASLIRHVIGLMFINQIKCMLFSTSKLSMYVCVNSRKCKKNLGKLSMSV